jgi:cell wall-associated NlpC family hydrolase
MADRLDRRWARHEIEGAGAPRVQSLHQGGGGLLKFRIACAAGFTAVAMTIAFPGTAHASIEAQGAPVASLEDDAKEDAQNALADRVIARAKTMIGTPWVAGGGAPGGFDCSGFTAWVYSAFGYSLPPSSEGQYALGDLKKYERIEKISDLRVGDLVFQQTGYPVGHVGIYVGNDRFISTTSSMGVQIRSLYDSYWGPLWMGGVRIL